MILSTDVEWGIDAAVYEDDLGRTGCMELGKGLGVYHNSKWVVVAVATDVVGLADQPMAMVIGRGDEAIVSG